MSTEYNPAGDPAQTEFWDALETRVIELLAEGRPEAVRRPPVAEVWDTNTLQRVRQRRQSMVYTFDTTIGQVDDEVRQLITRETARVFVKDCRSQLGVTLNLGHLKTTLMLVSELTADNPTRLAHESRCKGRPFDVGILVTVRWEPSTKDYQLTKNGEVVRVALRDAPWGPLFLATPAPSAAVTSGILGRDFDVSKQMLECVGWDAQEEVWVYDNPRSVDW